MALSCSILSEVVDQSLALLLIMSEFCVSKYVFSCASKNCLKVHLQII